MPTNLQNFTQKDLTEVKIFLKVLGGYFFETPCIFKCFIVLAKKVDVLSRRSPLTSISFSKRYIALLVMADIRHENILTSKYKCSNLCFR